jgi:hypothetical protein
MNDFRTSVSCTPSNQLISLKTPVLTVGSCFADAIGTRLKINKIFSLPNPFGAIYNPHSIHKSLQHCINPCGIQASAFIETHERVLSYDFHSSLSASTRDDLKKILDEKISEVHHFISKAHWIIITYGTAWVYQRNDTDEIVANCHKMPGKLFSKHLLTPKKIIESFKSFYDQLKTLNPDINIILTVSPVRHIKDTIEFNSVSKSVLRLACHTLSTSFRDVQYFPAYEIMLDDLRDYRFYKADMIHPTEVAEDYIWENFISCYADDDLKKFLPEWRTILSALSHRPFHQNSIAHQQFLKETLVKLERLKDRIDVQQEIQQIKSQQIS